MVISYKKMFNDSIIKRSQVLFYHLDNNSDIVIRTVKGDIIVNDLKLKTDITFRNNILFFLSLIGGLFYFYGGITFLVDIVKKEGIMSLFIPLLLYISLFVLFVYFMYKEKVYAYYGVYENPDLVLYLENENEKGFINSWLNKKNQKAGVSNVGESSLPAERSTV